MQRSRQRTNQHGFTLIELLVVVVILGILSAVVVFAVRGADDKGQAAAEVTDKRILRTALEAYCAQKSTYPVDNDPENPPDVMDMLIPNFLSNRSSYYSRIETGSKADFPQFEGNCGGQGYRLIGPVDGDGDGDTEPTGAFESILAPPFGQKKVGKLVALPDGRVFGYSVGGTDSDPEAALYDPADGTWLPATPPPLSPSDANGVLLVDDPGTAIVDCGIHCGKVMVHTPVSWFRFNPVGAGVWEPINAPGYSQKFTFAVNGAALLLDDPSTLGVAECGLDCGKVLITSYENTVRPPGTYADLYNPVADVFEPVDYPAGLEVVLATSGSMTRLKDGRILIPQFQYFNAYDGGKIKSAYLYDPLDRSFTATAAPTNPGNVTGEMGTTLPNGDVLFVPDDIYTPAPRGSGEGQGQWSKSGACAAGPGESCAYLGSTPGGVVLANVFKNGTPSAPNPQPTRQTRRFQLGSRTWHVAAELVSAESVGANAYLQGSGRILLANKTAEVYAP